MSYTGAAMKLTAVRSFAIGLLLSGCQVGAELADDDTSTDSVVVRGDGYFTLARDTRRCVSPICGGYWVSPVNASSLRCVDGTTADRCYVGALDLAGLGIGATSIDGAVVYRGRIAAATGNAYGRFVASEAWRSATGAAPTASVSRVSTTGTMCTFIPCATLNMQRLNSTARPLPVTGVDLSRLTTLSDSARDTVLGAATRDEGVLVAGVRTTAPGNPSTERVPVLRATQVFLRVEAPAARHCGTELQATFADATERLLFTSESDAPLTWFAPSGLRTVPTGAALLGLLGLPATTRVEQITLDRLMRNAVVADEGAGLEDQHRAARFRQLVQAVNRELTGVTVYRVGEVQVRIFIVGRTRCGTVAGLETLAIET